MSGALHIALCFDDYFWAPTYATMRSVCISTRRKTDLVFHLLHWHLEPEHQRDFDAITTEFGAQIEHYPLDAHPEITARLSGLPGTRRIPPIAYARLLLDLLLPAEVERFVYLDSDLLVRVPIETLLGIDLLGNAIAAAPEPGRQRLIRGDDMRDTSSPLDAADPYFNSGVILADRAAWAAADLPGLLERLKQAGELETLYHDQDVLNLAFRGRLLLLDPLWNLTKPHPSHRALDPHIVHYTTAMKPWNGLAYVAFGSTYKHVMTRELAARYAAYRRKVWLRRLFGWRT
jgi:lipopolysaccharide biosynthesis glycosyltransferase